MKNTGKLIFSILIILLTIHLAMAKPKDILTLKLDQAIQIAVKNNPKIKIAASKIKEAEGKIVQAKSFKAPKVTFLSKYFYTNNLPNFYPQAMKQVPVMSASGPVAGEYVPLRPLAPYPGNDGDVFTMDINLMLPLYTNGKITNANKNAQLLKELFVQNKNQSVAEIVYNVKKAFINILFLNNVISLNRKVIKQLETHYDLAKKAYEQGVRSEFEVISFEAKIEEFKSKLVDLKGKRKVAETGLKNLLNLALTDSVHCAGQLDILDTDLSINASEMFQKSLQTNFQVQMLTKKEKMYKNLKAIHAAANRPTLFSFANYHVYHGKNFPPYDQAWQNGWAVGAGVSVPLFDGNYTSGKVQETQASIEEIGQNMEGLKLKIRFEIKSLLQEFQSLRAQLASFGRTLNVAKKGFEIAQISYKNGVITNVQLNDAQLNVFRNQLQIEKIKKELLIKKAKLELIEGTIH